MAQLTAIRPTIAGVAWSPAAVSASDTIAAADIIPNGAYLIIINGGASPDTVTIVDPGTTPASSAATNPTNSVTNGTTEAMLISPQFVNPATGNVTIQHSFTTSVTCILIAR